MAAVGREWTAATFDRRGAGRFLAITAYQGGFAAVGTWPRDRNPVRDPRPRYGVWLSADGERWERVPHALHDLPRTITDLPSIVADRRGLVVAVADGLRLAVWRSPDGRQWRQVPDRSAFSLQGLPDGGQGYHLTLRSMAVSGDRLAILGSWWVNDCGGCATYSRVWTSDDARTWTAHRPGKHAPYRLTGLAGPGPAFVGLEPIDWRVARRMGLEGWSDTDWYRTVRSSDGVRWHRVVAGLPAGGSQSAFDPDTAGGWTVRDEGEDWSYPVVSASKDLRAWAEVFDGASTFGTVPASWTAETLTAADGIAVIIGDGQLGPWEAHQDFIWSLISSDGIDWELSAGWPAMRSTAVIRGVAIGHGKIVAVTEDGSVPILVTDATPVVPDPSQQGSAASRSDPKPGIGGGPA